jgi:circadian clock protein KaiB
MDKLSLTLFITGQTMRSRSAVQNLQTLFEEIGGERYELSIVDVLEHPQLAEDEKIVATPTLVKTSPLPVRRIVGDLTSRTQVLKWLDLGDPLEYELE